MKETLWSPTQEALYPIQIILSSSDPLPTTAASGHFLMFAKHGTTHAPYWFSCECANTLVHCLDLILSHGLCLLSLSVLSLAGLCKTCEITLLKQHKGQQSPSSRGCRVFQENSPLFSTDAKGLWEQNVPAFLSPGTPTSKSIFHRAVQNHLAVNLQTGSLPTVRRKGEINQRVKIPAFSS